MQIVLEIGLAGLECVRIPGWAALGVAGLLTAPRLVRDWLEVREK